MKAREIDDEDEGETGVLRNLDLGHDWLYAWGELPTNLHDLRRWLKERGVAVETFKNSARYEANYDRFPWLKDL